MHGGLEKAASPELGWKNQARTIVHIADAPGHGSRLATDFHLEGCDDEYPDYDNDGKMLEALLGKLRLDIKV